jgi:hypothetical protein
VSAGESTDKEGEKDEAREKFAYQQWIARAKWGGPGSWVGALVCGWRWLRCRGLPNLVFENLKNEVRRPADDCVSIAKRDGALHELWIFE